MLWLDQSKPKGGSEGRIIVSFAFSGPALTAGQVLGAIRQKRLRPILSSLSTSQTGITTTAPSKK